MSFSVSECRGQLRLCLDNCCRLHSPSGEVRLPVRVLRRTPILSKSCSTTGSTPTRPWTTRTRGSGSASSTKRGAGSDAGAVCSRPGPSELAIKTPAWRSGGNTTAGRVVRCSTPVQRLIPLSPSMTLRTSARVVTARSPSVVRFSAAVADPTAGLQGGHHRAGALQ